MELIWMGAGVLALGVYGLLATLQPVGLSRFR